MYVCYRLKSVLKTPFFPSRWSFQHMILIDVCSEGCVIFIDPVSSYIRKGEQWFQMPHLTEEANGAAERLREVEWVAEVKLPMTARTETAKQVSCISWFDVSAEWLWIVFRGSLCYLFPGVFLAPWLVISIWPSIHSLVLTQCNWNSIPFPGAELGKLSWLWLGLIFWCVFAASSSGLWPWQGSLQVSCWVCLSLCKRGEKHLLIQSKIYKYPISPCSQ